MRQSFHHACRAVSSLGIAARGVVAPGAHSGSEEQATVPLYFFSDAAFKPLRDQFVNSLVDTDLLLHEAYVDDLGALPNRAAGGTPVYMFKTKLLLDALDATPEGDYFVITDVDIQFLGEVLPLVREGIAGRDVCFQREFDEMGVNIGFVAVRNTAASRRFWHDVLEAVPVNGGHDQRIVNNMLYTGTNMQWGRFPPQVWASSQAFDGGPPPRDVVVHHANWVMRDAPTYSGNVSTASDPSPKIEQLKELRELVQEEASEDEEVAAAAAQRRVAWGTRIADDPPLAVYHGRSFGAMRRGPCWEMLPEGHPARPGGSRRLK